jgi:hypothetical protein
MSASLETIANQREKKETPFFIRSGKGSIEEMNYNNLLFPDVGKERGLISWVTG